MRYSKITYDLNGSSYQPRKLNFPTDSEFAIGVEFLKDGLRVSLDDDSVKIIDGDQEIESISILNDIAIFQMSTTSSTKDGRSLEVQYWKDGVKVAYYKPLLVEQTPFGEAEIACAASGDLEPRVESLEEGVQELSSGMTTLGSSVTTLGASVTTLGASVTALEGMLDGYSGVQLSGITVSGATYAWNFLGKAAD